MFITELKITPYTYTRILKISNQNKEYFKLLVLSWRILKLDFLRLHDIYLLNNLTVLQ